MAQNFQNHAKFVPAFHYFALPVLGINFIWSIMGAVSNPSVGAIRGVFVAAALVVTCLYARLFALAVQDRVIRLEMRLRMERLLPEDLQAHIGEFTVSQLVALRFAGDAELATLARKVIEEKINSRTAIKKMVQNWQEDGLRA